MPDPLFPPRPTLKPCSHARWLKSTFALAFAVTLALAALHYGAFQAGILGSFTVTDHPYDPSFPRACSSTGTVFETVSRPAVAIQVFRKTMDEVVAEREDILAHPSKWSCAQMQQPEMRELTKLARSLPAWQYKVKIPWIPFSKTLWIRKPITFDDFPSIVMEFERAYECRLAEFQAQGIALVGVGAALGSPDTPPETLGTYAAAVQRNRERIQQERTRARIAIERTLAALRSYELSLPLARNLHCIERAGLDLRSELNLLAQAISCVPKIWDGVTSLHDRQP